jgi:transposase
MLTWEDDIDEHALRRQGWTISAIARHLGRDRKTIRAYLSGREAGVRATSRADPFDPFDPFVAYCAERLKGDPHLWASTWANTPPRHSRGVAIGRSPGGWAGEERLSPQKVRSH